jgi:hypothetical protein
MPQKLNMIMTLSQPTQTNYHFAKTNLNTHINTNINTQPTSSSRQVITPVRNTNLVKGGNMNSIFAAKGRRCG